MKIFVIKADCKILNAITKFLKMPFLRTQLLNITLIIIIYSAKAIQLSRSSSIHGLIE